MFDWFWDFLYSISKSIFQLIDSLLSCANILCGIEPIRYEGEEVNFMNFLLSNDRISLGFKSAAIFGIVLVGAFSIFAILRSVVSEKSNTTPMRTLGSALKTILLFAFVPACMIVMIRFTNMFMDGLYKATLGGSSNGMGNFLCGAFSNNALLPGTDPNYYVSEGFNYLDTDCVRTYIELDDFDFFFSWIAGVCILVELAKSLLMFVDRTLSIVTLFIVAPVSISTSVVDDGAHFKLWRDQLLVKFLSGYGCILALNIYALVISIISDDRLVFVQGSSFLNNLMKIAFILGGAVSTQRVTALIGNLVSSGAGSNEMREGAMAAAGFRGAVGALGGALLSPFRGARSAYNFGRDTKEHGFAHAAGSRLGFKTDRDYGKKSKEEQEAEATAKKNEQTSLANMIGDRVADAISGKKSSENASPPASANKSNNNNPVSKPNGNNAVMNAISNTNGPTSTRLADEEGNKKP